MLSNKVEKGLNMFIDGLMKKKVTFKQVGKGLLLVGMGISMGATYVSGLDGLSGVGKGYAVSEEPIAVNVEESYVGESTEGKLVVADTVLDLEGSGIVNDKQDEEQRQFVREIAPIAVDVADEYGVYPSVIMAQAIIESNWGRSELAVNANNLFGIKGQYNGQSYTKSTQEDNGTGYLYTIVDDFAKYPSIKESVVANAHLIRNGVSYDNGLYSGAWVENAGDYKQASASLVGVYATDTGYEAKVNRVITEHNLYVLDNILYQ